MLGSIKNKALQRALIATTELLFYTCTKICAGPLFLPKVKSVADQEHFAHKVQQVLQLFLLLLEQTLCPFPVTEIKQSARAVMPAEGWEMALEETGIPMRNGTQQQIALSRRGG